MNVKINVHIAKVKVESKVAHKDMGFSNDSYKNSSRLLMCHSAYWTAVRHRSEARYSTKVDQ